VSHKVQFLEEFRIGDEERDVGLVDLGDDPQEQESGRDQELAAAHEPVAVAAPPTSDAAVSPLASQAPTRARNTAFVDLAHAPAPRGERTS
jgi:hypothetical protein